MSRNLSRHPCYFDLQNLRADPAHSAAASALVIAGREQVNEITNLSEQGRYNEMLVSTQLKLAPAKKMKKILGKASRESYDPIENAMQRFPTLTREKAEEMAKAFGF